MIILTLVSWIRLPIIYINSIYERERLLVVTGGSPLSVVWLFFTTLYNRALFDTTNLKFRMGG
jgi:hypothetical protein